MDLPANTEDTPLPQVYQTARQALAQCQKLDECKDWADKAIALASYARQSQDDELLMLATRIKARAARRCGELLNEIQRPEQGGRPPKNGDGDDPVLTRKQAADDAGLSERQRKQSIRIAKIPEEEFNARVDDIKPPTIKELIKPHVSHNSGENEWYTPSYLVDAARQVMGSIYLDPASSAVANGTVGAKVFFSKEDDGLSREWFSNVWLNPPYSQPDIDRFSKKLCDELPIIKSACVLVNNATETAWFQRMAKKSDAICLLEGRIKFIDQSGNASGAPLQGQVVLYFGESPSKFVTIFSAFGLVLGAMS